MYGITYMYTCNTHVAPFVMYVNTSEIRIVGTMYWTRVKGPYIKWPQS